MGTRHLISVVLNNEFKVAQYGQWDGYPLGQGNKIVQFVLNNLMTNEGLEIFKNKIKECYYINLEEIEEVGEYVPQEFDRDTGSEILDLILERDTPVSLINNINFASDSLFCEWAYVLDLDNQILEVYEGFNKKTPIGRFASFPSVSDEDNYKPITLIKSYSFSELNKDTMELLNKELEVEE